MHGFFHTKSLVRFFFGKKCKPSDSILAWVRQSNPSYEHAAQEFLL